MNADSQVAPGGQRLQCDAPAKINFGLRITGRRPDGYHELASLFLPLDLADGLQVDLAPAAAPKVGLVVELPDAVAGAEVPSGDSNIAVRAARAFLAEAGIAAAVEIRLRKRIPAAAGLGGGSSDAGAVLRLLATAHPDAVAPDRLARLALELGADVPYFLDPQPAWVTGIGERVEPVPGWPPLALVLANPGVPLATAEVYRAADALGSAAPGGALPAPAQRATLARNALPDRPGDLAALLQNDLEPAALRLCPPVARLRERLRGAGAAAVGMSGSGPTVFGVFPGADEARAGLEAAAFEAPIWARVAVAGKSG